MTIHAMALAAELVEMTAGDAINGMRRGDFTAEAYAEALLGRCEAGAALNAFITLEPSRVLEDARAADRRRAAGEALGPLHGLPIPIKDSVNTRDLPTTVGTNALRGFRPEADASAVARLREAGAIVLGKTNLHELSLGWTSDNQAFGPVRNPYDLSRTPGGSSGGTAAAVASRMAPLGVAEDTQGSIRVPAALCGVAGFRPTTGRYPTDGTAPITPLFDQIGPHARSVSDLALFDAVMTGDERAMPRTALRGLRIGVDRSFYFADLDPVVAAMMEDALGRLRDVGVVVVEAPVGGMAGVIEATAMTIQAHDVAPALSAYLRASGAPVDLTELVAKVSGDVKALLDQIALPGALFAVSETAYLAARDERLPALRRMMQAWFAENDLAAMLLPATMVPAPLIGQADVVRIDGRDIPFMTAMARNITPGSTLGLPGLVLPVGLTPTSGLPVSLELDGPAGADRRLLGIGAAIEALLDPLPPPPPYRV
jgi:mandelamide amidase